jgi:hypothetical protein
MATTTTNFGWDIPQSTDLVKDGATAIAALGQDIDTAFVDLKGGTSGQVLSKNSNTDLDFTWVTSDDANAIQNSIIDAKGDLIVGTADNTPARLPIGSNNFVLTADSSQTSGMKWAAAASGGGMTLLSTTTLSGASTTIGSINNTYKNLYVEVENISNVSAANQIFCIPNNSTSKMVYVASTTQTGGSGFVGYRYVDDTNINLTSSIKTFGNTNNFWSFNFYNYASSTTRKTFDMIGGYVTSSGNENQNVTGYYNENTAISSLVFTTNGGNWAGGTVRVYGVN